MNDRRRHSTNRPARYGGLCLRGLIGLVLVAGAGCAASDERSAERFVPQGFPNDAQTPRVVVHGPLTFTLPAYDSTPALDRFLYGPNREGKTPLRNPQGMTVVGKTVYVCDQGQPDIMAIDLETGRFSRWCDFDDRPRCPVDVTHDDTGRLFVADTTLRAVLVYSPDGKMVDQLMPEAGPDRTFRPCAVAVHQNTLSIGDLGGRCVARYDLAGNTWLASLEPTSPRPALIAPTGLAVTPQGVLLVADAVAGRVQRVTRDGEWLEPIGHPGRGEGEFVRPKQVCCTPDGLILVTDAARQSVLVFEEDGTHVTEIHERADAWRGWTLPSGLLVVPSGAAAIVTGHDADASAGGCTVIVSDALGGDSLTRLEVIGGAKREGHDAP